MDMSNCIPAISDLSHLHSFRAGFASGMRFVLEEMAHAHAADRFRSSKAEADRACERIAWLLERIEAAECISLEKLDHDLPRLDCSRVNDPLPDLHAVAPDRPGVGCQPDL